MELMEQQTYAVTRALVRLHAAKVRPLEISTLKKNVATAEKSMAHYVKKTTLGAMSLFAGVGSYIAFLVAVGTGSSGFLLPLLLVAMVAFLLYGFLIAPGNYGHAKDLLKIRKSPRAREEAPQLLQDIDTHNRQIDEILGALEGKMDMLDMLDTLGMSGVDKDSFMADIVPKLEEKSVRLRTQLLAYSMALAGTPLTSDGSILIEDDRGVIQETTSRLLAKPGESLNPRQLEQVFRHLERNETESKDDTE